MSKKLEPWMRKPEDHTHGAAEIYCHSLLPEGLHVLAGSPKIARVAGTVDLLACGKGEMYGNSKLKKKRSPYLC
jgi:hypothetical protein